MCRVFIGSSVILDHETTAVKSASSKDIRDFTVVIQVSDQLYVESVTVIIL